MNYGFGVDLGGTTVKIAFFDKNGTMIDKWEIPTVKENQGAQILPDIARSISAYVQEKGIEKESLLGIGIGVPGPVDQQGAVSGCVNLGWGYCDVAGQLEYLTGLPVRAGNDATVAALGECWKGSGNGCKNMIFVTLGTGVGGGIIIDGKPLHGVHGAGGEIGHMTLHPYGDYCNCGRMGCAEVYCSATGISNTANCHMITEDRPTMLSDFHITAKDLFDAAKENDAVALDILKEVYDNLGLFLANLAAVIDPEMIVLGGGVSKAGDILIQGVRRSFDRYAFPGTKEVHLALAQLGNDAGAYGAFKLILE